VNLEEASLEGPRHRGVMLMALLQPGRAAVHLKVERAKPRRIEEASEPAQGPSSFVVAQDAVKDLTGGDGRSRSFEAR
jgi:hypothetical protein